MTTRPFVRKMALAAAGLCLLASGAGMAQVKKGKTRPALTSEIMKGTVKPHMDAVKKGLDVAEKTPEIWSDLRMHAALLNESSHALMDDGRSPDAAWSDATIKSLRAGTADLVKAIDAKDGVAAKAALGLAGKSCKGCHDVHKPKK